MTGTPDRNPVGHRILSQKKYLVTLTSDERGHLDDLLRKGKASPLVPTRARILLQADQADGGPAPEGAAIAEDLGVGLRTIGRVRERFVERGFEDGLRRKTQDKPSRVRTRDGIAEAKRIALACPDPPADRDGWAMQLLADKLVERKVVNAIGGSRRRSSGTTPRSTGTGGTWRSAGSRP